MDRNIKYKQVCRVGLYGDDDINTTSTSQYSLYPASISSITVLTGGSNYVAANTQVVLTSCNNNSSGFYATANVTSGAVSSVTINNPGSAFVSVPNIAILSGVVNTSGLVAGNSYTPGTFNLIITGGGGSGAAGTFVVTAGGTISTVTITNAGTGYSSAPNISFANSTGGTGASVTAVIGSGATIAVSGIYTNGKRMRFALNNALNDLKLSVNARCIVEMCNVPSFQNMAGKYVVIRLVTATQDKTCDTKKFLNGNPILLSMATQATLGSTNVLYNASEFFYNINVPTNLFSNGYLDLELEVPSATTNIDFITNKPLNTFFLNLIIVDNDPELTTDLTLAPPIDYKNYNVNMPIKQY